MYPGHAPPVVTYGILGIALALAVLFVAAERRAAIVLGAPDVARRTALAALGMAAWLGASSLAAISGVLARFDARPPPLLLLMVAVMAGAVLFARSRAATPLVEGLPLWALVAFQSFRLPLELVMHEAAASRVMPAQMSYSGLNFDIVTGITACLLAPWIATGRAPRAVVLAWNVMGSALLAVIVVVAVVSTPMVHAFGPDALNDWVAYFPFVLLPAVMVAFALVGHVLLFRALARDVAFLGFRPAER